MFGLPSFFKTQPEAKTEFAKYLSKCIASPKCEYLLIAENHTHDPLATHNTLLNHKRIIDTSPNKTALFLEKLPMLKDAKGGPRHYTLEDLSDLAKKSKITKNEYDWYLQCVESKKIDLFGTENSKANLFLYLQQTLKSKQEIHDIMIEAKFAFMKDPEITKIIDRRLKDDTCDAEDFLQIYLNSYIFSKERLTEFNEEVAKSMVACHNNAKPYAAMILICGCGHIPAAYVETPKELIDPGIAGRIAKIDPKAAINCCFVGSTLGEAFQPKIGENRYFDTINGPSFPNEPVVIEKTSRFSLNPFK